MFKGPTGPQSGQTSRSIAEQKNDARNFTADPEGGYFPQGGHPVTKDLPKQEYKEAEMTGGGNAKPLDTAVPFTIKGG